MKKFLEKLLAEKRDAMTALKEKSEASQSLEEVRAIGVDLEKLNKEIKDIEDQLAKADERAEIPAGAQLRHGDIVGSFGAQAKEEDGMEYRKAFMDLVLRGTPIPAELRDDANTLTTNVGSAIPTVLVNRIVEKLDNVGMILPLITKTTYAAGVTIPTSTVKPVASWVAEGASSDRQNKTTGTISFTYHKLRCEISMSMEVGTMAISAFESKFVENVANAMTYAIENAVINGTGSGQPKGILAETPVTGQSLTGTAYEFKKLMEAEGALPVQYESSAKWCMSKKTFAQILAMTDTTGQPIARVNYGMGGKPERTLFGRDVVITPYVAEHTLFMFDFSDYVLNTIYDMGITRKQDWDTEDLLTKAVMSVDGKVVSKDSFVKVVLTIS